jgi:serine/threonine protein kinase
MSPTRVERDTVIDGRYRVLKRIGSGGMAEVYCVEDQQLGRRVALKLLHRRFADDEQFVERFRREASSAAGLSHPNIVGIFDRGEWDGTYYIAMEFVEGRTLKDIVRERGAAPPEAAADITLQILRALRFAHQRGIVHRDIKPQNVLIDNDGRVRVADFGIARAGVSDMTETGSVMGTAQYLSPEQAQGKPVDARSDLYSTGVVLYELLTGRVPFDAE